MHASVQPTRNSLISSCKLKMLFAVLECIKLLKLRNQLHWTVLETDASFWHRSCKLRQKEVTRGSSLTAVLVHVTQAAPRKAFANSFGSAAAKRGRLKPAVAAFQMDADNDV